MCFLKKIKVNELLFVVTSYVLKTLSLDHTKVRNIAPRYGKLMDDGKCIGYTNNELITDRPLDLWLDEIRELKKQFPEKNALTL